MNTLTASLRRDTLGRPIAEIHGAGPGMAVTVRMTPTNVRHLAIALVTAAREIEELGGTEIVSTSFPRLIPVEHVS